MGYFNYTHSIIKLDMKHINKVIKLKFQVLLNYIP